MHSLLSTNVHLCMCSNQNKNRLGHPQIVRRTKCFRPKKTDRRHIRRCVKALGGSGDDEFRTLRRIIRLQSAIRNKSIKDFAELICDECKYLCASLPAIHLSQLSKKVLDLFLLTMMRSNVMFVIKPRADHGVDAGVSLVAEWTETSLPIGFGLDIYTSHYYKGVVLIKKANSLLEPLLHLKELPRKLEEILSSLIGKVVPESLLEGKRKEIFMYCFLGLVVMAISYVLLKCTFV